MEISPASEMEPLARQLGPGRRRKTLAHFSSLRARRAVCQRRRSAFFPPARTHYHSMLCCWPTTLECELSIHSSTANWPLL